MSSSLPLQSPALDPVWRAHYAWSRERGGPGLAVRFFRCVFSVTPAREAFVIHVTADSRYRLWLNDERVGFGPAKGSLARYHFETYDLRPLLRPGRNVLAAEVRWFGENSPASEVHAPLPGFVVQAQATRELDTPGKWRVWVDDSVTPDTTPYISNAHQFLGFWDRIDTRREPVGWRDIAFDDSGWSDSISLGPAAAIGAVWGVAAMRTLVSRDVAMMQETPLRFARAIVERRAIANPFQTVTQLRHSFGEYPAGWSVPAGQSGTILLETHRYATGFPELEFVGGAGREVRVMYAEALGEWVTEEGKRTWRKGEVRDDFSRFEPHGYRDTLILRGGELAWEPFYWRAFRFLQLEVLPGDAPLTIRDARYRLCVHPQPFVAKFESSDPQSAAIFDVSVHTFRVGAHEIYDDSPYYEQLSYIADTRIEALASLHLCNETQLPKRNLRLFLETLRSDGLIDSRVPCHYARQTIPYFCLHWIFMLEDYWRWVGRADAAFVRECLVAADSILTFFRSRLRNDGFIGITGGWNMVDDIPEWPNGEPPSVVRGGSTYLTCVFIEALDVASRLHGQAGHPEDALRWLELSRRLAAIVRREAWESRAEFFRESINVSETYFSQHVQAAAINSGVATESQMRRVAPRIASEPALVQARSMQAFYVARALERAHAFSGWHTHLLRPWRRYLAQHVSTWPEYPDPSRSDSHAWSAWPGVDYITSVLGIRPLAPGWTGVRFTPQTGGLDWARGIAPSPVGPIRMEWERGVRGIRCRAEVPDNFLAEVIIPGREPLRFTRGGRLEFELPA